MTAAGLSNLVVEVLHNRGDDNHPDWSVGSGFFVGPRLVLTALHNVDGQGKLLVRVHGTEERPAIVSLQGDKNMDLAVLEVSDVAVDIPSLRYGEVDRSEAKVVKECRAVGFPRFKEQAHEPKPMRLSAQVDGEIPTGENMDQPLLTLRVRNSPRPLPSSTVRESEWAGMSGAAVFSDNNIIVGVITEHHLPEGESALTVVPITAIDLLPEATKWWELLGVDRQAFVRLPDEAYSSLSLSTRPKNYIPFPHNPLFQPRPNEFEQLEHLLFELRREKLPPRLGLVGMGGIGKTQLAIELAYRFQYRFRAGVIWMTATGKNAFDWQRQLAALAFDTEYLPPNDNPSSPDNERRRALHLCRYLADHQDALLILDNVDDPSLVMTALPALAGGKVACSVLYTSRVTLPPEGGAIYPVEQLSEESALRLLLQETRQSLLAQIEAEQINPEMQSARIICQLVSYLPLALMFLRELLRRDRHLTLARLQQELTQRGVLNLFQALFSTFELSWEKVQDEEAQRMFKLACYFPEADRIPLWLLGLAAGLGEEGDILTPLGKAQLQLQELSLLQVRSDNEVSLHPLVREFGLALVAKAVDRETALLEDAGKRLTKVCLDLNWLEQRAQRRGYWECLDRVRAIRNYVELLGSVDEAKQIGRVERWLDRESYLLGDERWWPTRLPALFYQQLYNRSIEEGIPLVTRDASVLWLRQIGQVGAENSSLLRVFRGHAGWIWSVAFSPDGTQVLTGSEDRTARIWETKSGKLLKTLEGHQVGIWAVAFSFDGTRVLTGSRDQIARLWEAKSGELLKTLKGQSSEILSLAFSSDGARVLTGSRDQIARLREVESGKLLTTMEGHTDGAWSVTFSSDGINALTGSGDGTVRLWEVKSGKLLKTLEGHTDIVRSVAFSSDGTRVLTGSSDGKARLWEVKSGKLRATLRSHVDRVLCATFSPDGTRVLTGSSDQTAQVWETESGQPLATLQGHTGEIWSVAFSSDGARVLTGSRDQTARLWETADGKLLTTLEGHAGIVRSVAFSPDDYFIITCHQPGWVLLWHASELKADYLRGVYVAAYEIRAVHWQKTTQVMLADTGGLQCLPHFYQLKLEGMGK